MDASIGSQVQQNAAATGRRAIVRSASTHSRHAFRKLLLASIVFLVCGEIGSRLYWSFTHGAPLLGKSSLWYAFYPQLRTTGVEDAVITNTDATYDVLILGGSTISEGFGTIGHELAAGLEKGLGRPVRVYNLAYAAHNSRDSLLKFRRLARQRFDLVVIYHGINDARMNNAPPGKFRADYSHCCWYKHLNFLDSHPRWCTAALPFTLLYAYDGVADQLGLAWYAPRLNPTDELKEFGKDIRTREPFRRNLEEIVAGARDQGSHVLLMSYAYHVPTGLSLDDAAGAHADYAGGKSMLGIWGKPAYVIQAMDEHNAALRELAARHPEALFVDQDKLMPRSGKMFHDCCHLTPAGCTRFVDHMLTALVGVKTP